MASVELVVEYFEIFEDFGHMACGVDQICDTEVVSALLLAETRTWNRHYTSLVNHLHAVDKVRLLTLLFRIVQELL